MTERLCDVCWGIDGDTRHVTDSTMVGGGVTYKHHECCAGEGCGICLVLLATDQVIA